jgi:hypothetical protein
MRKISCMLQYKMHSQAEVLLLLNYFFFELVKGTG